MGGKRAEGREGRKEKAEHDPGRSRRPEDNLETHGKIVRWRKAEALRFAAATLTTFQTIAGPKGH